MNLAAEQTRRGNGDLARRFAAEIVAEGHASLGATAAMPRETINDAVVDVGDRDLGQRQPARGSGLPP
jgi:hypothetical protein